MTCDLIIISDGRGYLRESVPSLMANADPGWFGKALIIEDGDATVYPIEAETMLNDWGVPAMAVNLGGRHGGAAAIQAAWAMTLNSHPPSDYVFHLEEDWTFNERIPIHEMDWALDVGDIANIVLRRQPWGSEGPGGYIGDDPAAFHPTAMDSTPSGYLAHNKGFWLNPCLIRREVLELGWPDNGHEHDFTAKCRAANYRFAVYGGRDDEPLVTHIGDRRADAWTW
jgi:hypothetical protein